MTVLRRTGVSVSAPGTLVTPEDGTALAIARQIMAEGYGRDDLESLVVPDQGVGAPVTVGDDRNKGILYRDTATNSVYLRVDDATSDQTAYILIGSAQQPVQANHPATGQPVITGVREQGETLTASLGSIDDADGVPDIADFSWQWTRNGVNIVNADQQTYDIVADDVGRTLRVVAVFNDDAGNRESRTSAAANIPQVAPPGPVPRSDPHLYMAVKVDAVSATPAELLIGVFTNDDEIMTDGIVDGQVYVTFARRSDLGPAESISSFFEERDNFSPDIGDANDSILINGGEYYRYTDKYGRLAAVVNDVPYTIGDA